MSTWNWLGYLLSIYIILLLPSFPINHCLITIGKNTSTSKKKRNKVDQSQSSVFRQRISLMAFLKLYTFSSANVKNNGHIHFSKNIISRISGDLVNRTSQKRETFTKLTDWYQWKQVLFSAYRKSKLFTHDRKTTTGSPWCKSVYPLHSKLINKYAHSLAILQLCSLLRVAPF